MKEEPLTPEQKAASLRRETAAVEGETEERAEASANEGTQAVESALDERMLTALHAASDRKALDIVALDLREVASFTDLFLIASATNVRQVQAIADAVVERLRDEHRTRPARVEGYNTAEWVLLDYGDFIFHVFEEKARRFYDLERLWRDAARVPLPPDITSERSADAAGDERGGAESSLRRER